MPTYLAIRAATHALLRTLPGLTVLDFEPRAIQHSPTLYSLLDSAQRSMSGQIVTMRYRIIHRLCVKWQDNEAAEEQLAALVNAIPALIDSDPQLGGLLPRGLAFVEEIQTGYLQIGGAMQRTCDVYNVVVAKHTYQEANL